MKEGQVLFNDALNTFYLALYDVGCLISQRYEIRLFSVPQKSCMLHNIVIIGTSSHVWFCDLFKCF